MTLGERLANYRKKSGLTQEQVADKMNVSAQAVSKWENDVSSPDISALMPLAELYNVSVDVLLGGEEKVKTTLNKTKDFNELICKVRITSEQGSKVNVNLPMALIKVFAQASEDGKQNNFKFNGSDVNIDFNQIVELVQQGVLGKIVEIEDGDDHVEIFVE